MVLLSEEALFWKEKLEAVGERKGNQAEIRCLLDSEVTERKQEFFSVHSSAFGCSKAETEWIFESSFSEGMKLWGYWIEGRLIGICFVSITEQTYFLSAVSIGKEEQRKGYGEDFLKKLLCHLWKQDRKAVFLQVSGENRAAVRLYRKLGFSVRQQLTTYRMNL